MAILQHVSAESGVLVKGESTGKVLTYSEAQLLRLVEMMETRAGACPSRIGKVGRPLAIYGTRATEIAEKSPMDIYQLFGFVSASLSRSMVGVVLKATRRGRVERISTGGPSRSPKQQKQR
jgi:hypothetical protein